MAAVVRRVRNAQIAGRVSGMEAPVSPSLLELPAASSNTVHDYQSSIQVPRILGLTGGRRLLRTVAYGEAR